MTLDDLLRLAAEATPGPAFDFVCEAKGHGNPDWCSIHGDIPRTMSILDHIESAHGIGRNEYWAREDAEQARSEHALAAHIAAFSPEVAAALVKVAMALPQALDRMQTAWDLLHPGDLTDDERDGIAQALWFGIEEGDPLVDALDAVLAARP